MQQKPPELLWSINKLKQGLWCTIWLSYIYIYTHIYTHIGARAGEQGGKGGLDSRPPKNKKVNVFVQKLTQWEKAHFTCWIMFISVKRILGQTRLSSIVWFTLKDLMQTAFVRYRWIELLMFLWIFYAICTCSNYLVIYWVKKIASIASIVFRFSCLTYM